MAITGGSIKRFYNGYLLLTELTLHKHNKKYKVKNNKDSSIRYFNVWRDDSCEFEHNDIVGVLKINVHKIYWTSEVDSCFWTAKSSDIVFTLEKIE